jgi:hypothetical protein
VLFRTITRQQRNGKQRKPFRSCYLLPLCCRIRLVALAECCPEMFAAALRATGPFKPQPDVLLPVDPLQQRQFRGIVRLAFHAHPIAPLSRHQRARLR